MSLRLTVETPPYLSTALSRSGDATVIVTDAFLALPSDAQRRALAQHAAAVAAKLVWLTRAQAALAWGPLALGGLSGAGWLVGAPLHDALDAALRAAESALLGAALWGIARAALRAGGGWLARWALARALAL